METPPKKNANERKMLADYSQGDIDLPQFGANLPHVALKIDNGKLLGRITKGPRPFLGKCWSLLPIEKNACIDMMWEGPNDFKLLVPLNNINIEKEDYIFPDFSISKSMMDKLKSLESVDISFHYQDSRTEVGSFDVDIASLSTIEDVEQFEPQEDPVDFTDMRFQSSECQPCEQSRTNDVMDRKRSRPSGRSLRMQINSDVRKEPMILLDTHGHTGITVEPPQLSTPDDIGPAGGSDNMIEMSPSAITDRSPPATTVSRVVEADMLDIPHNPSSVDVNEIIDLQSIDPEEVVNGVNAPIQPPLAAENRENSISESSSLSLPDDIPYTMNFLSMIDLVEDITPGVLGEMSSDEDTDTS